MGGEVVAGIALGDEGAQLDVLPCHFLGTHLGAQNLLQFFLGRHVVHACYLFCLLLVEVVLETVEHAVESHFGGIGNEGEDGISRLAVDGIVDGLHELLAKFLSLLIDVAVGTTTEINALKRALGISFSGYDFLDRTPSVLIDNQRMAGWQFDDILTFQAKRCLQDGALAGQHDDFVVHVIECRTNAPGVAKGKHLAASRESAHHIAAIEIRHRGLQDVRHLDMVFNIACYRRVLESLLLGFHEVALHLAIQTVPHQLEGDVGITVDARALALVGNLLEDLVDVGHVEVSAEAEVLGPPIVSAQKRMYIRKATLAGG